MSAPHPSAVRLLGVLVLAGVLMLGRTTISAHAYEHDLAESAHGCEFCESLHVSGKDAITDSPGAIAPEGPGARLELLSAAAPEPIRPAVRARDPPRPSV